MSAPTVDEFNQLRAQNEQLWKIIERQRTMIQSLQKENSHLAAERDGLQDNVNTFERARKQRASVLFSPEALKAMMTEVDDEPSPMPPPRSPYRSNSGKPEPQPLKAHKEQLLRQKGKQLNFTLDTSDTTLSTNTLQQTPTSPRNVILEKDAQHMQKFKNNNSNKPTSPSFVMPMPSVSSPISTNTPIDEPSLSSSYSSSTSSFLRPTSPPDGTSNQRSSASNRSKRESHIFFSPPPVLPPPPPPPPPSTLSGSDGPDLGSDGHFNGLGQAIEPTPQLPQHSMSSASATTTLSSLSSSSSSSISASPFAGGITNIAVKVLGSNIRQNEKSREVISFIISVGKKPDEFNMEYEELWRVEKLYSHFLELDSKLKSSHRSVANRIAKLPDKALFTTNSPSKVDRRKAALEQYLHHIVLLPLEDSSDLCEFLSTNVVDNDVMYSRTGRKEGYLTKRGKNFGGWKTRYFVLNGTSLEYYESKEGNHLGTIRLVNARIGRQTPGTSVDENNSYRHAFLIVEQKRSGSSQMYRHILCAESDQDRDDWVDALFKNVTLEDEKQYLASSSNEYVAYTDNNSNNNNTGTMKKKPTKSMSSKSGSSYDSDFDKLRPSMTQDSNEIGVALTGPPIAINESSESLPSTWSSSTLPPPPIVFDQRTSLDQPRTTYTMPLNGQFNSSNSLQPRTPHNLTRRSSMVNLLNTENEEEIILPARAMSPSPAFGRESEELLGDDLPEKKTKHKRMTFWGKKMFNNNSNETLVVPARPSPSSSSSTSNTNDNTTVEMTTSLSSGVASTQTSSSSSGFRGFLSRPSHENGRSSSNHKDTHQTPQHPVFGVPLEESVRVSRVSDTYQLPSIVFRCLEYLDAKKAILEEGLYRLSGSNIMMKSLKQKFDLEGDINLLAAKEEYDVHAIAGLLKMWLRELPTSVLTRERRMDFLHVIDLLDRKDRVNELGRLVSLLPIANYTLLRALTAHLIQVVQHSDVNKMTMRNVSIVFSPTLGIPGTIFNLLMSEFDYIFWTTEDGDAAPRMILDDENTVYETPTKVLEEEEEDPQQLSTATVVVVTTALDDTTTTNNTEPSNKLGRKPTLQLRDGRSNRNSVNYREAAPNTIVELEKQHQHNHHHHGQLMLDEIEDEVNDLALTDDDYSIVSSDDKLQATAITI